MRTRVLAFLAAALLILFTSVASRAQGFSTMFLQPSGSTPIPALTDSLGRLYTVPDSSGLALLYTLYTSTALEGTKVVSAVPAVLAAVVVTAQSGPGYLMVWNSTTVPADGAVTPALCFYLPYAPGSFGFTTNFRGSAGVAIAFSTGATCYSKTASASVTFMTWSLAL